MDYPAAITDWQRTISVLLALFCMAMTGESLAIGGNLGFLKDAPITRFDDADRKLFQNNTFSALDDDADGATRSWENPKTGSSGSITIRKTFEDDGKRCRSTQIVNQARGSTAATSLYTFCQQTDGRWVVAPVKRAK